MTRQQIVGASGTNTGFLMQQQVQHTSQPATPQAEAKGPRAEVAAAATADPPLFGRSAQRVMESWPSQAPFFMGRRGVRLELKMGLLHLSLVNL